MTLTLYIEVNGRIKKKEECAYEDKEKIADKLRGLYPGKEVVIFYKLKSKMNGGTTNNKGVCIYR